MQYFEHFSCKEFFPNCSVNEVNECFKLGYFDNLLTLLMVLDGFRDYLNLPIVITSSYRDVEHNKRVGGSVTSDHLTASAIDFKCDSIPFNSLICHFRDFFKQSALRRFLGQVIFYKSKYFIHIALCTPKHPKLTYLSL